MGLLNSAGLIVIITAFVFGSSTAYTNAELSVLGLNSDLMERSFHQVLYHGVIMNLVFMFFIPFSLFLVSFFYYKWVAFIQQCFCPSNKSRFKNARRYLKPLRKGGVKFKKERNALKRLGLAKDISWITLSIFVGLVILVASHERDGAAAGRAIIESVKDGSAPKVYVGDDPKEYALLYCGAKNCAAYDTEKKLIKYFVQDQFSVTNAIFK